MFRFTALALAATLPLPALADPVDSAAAQTQLYIGAQVEVIQVDMSGLSAEETTLLTTIAASQKFYAALAFAPALGIMAEPTMLAANHHSPESARAAALAGCNERRGRSGRACVIALEVRPTGWEARDLSLSADATAGFDTDYRPRRGNRALAASPSTGQWGIGRGRSATDDAMSACQGTPAVSDCVILIAD